MGQSQPNKNKRRLWRRIGNVVVVVIEADSWLMLFVSVIIVIVFCCCWSESANEIEWMNALQKRFTNAFARLTARLFGGAEREGIYASEYGNTPILLLPLLPCRNFCSFITFRTLALLLLTCRAIHRLLPIVVTVVVVVVLVVCSVMKTKMAHIRKIRPGLSWHWHTSSLALCTCRHECSCFFMLEYVHVCLYILATLLWCLFLLRGMFNMHSLADDFLYLLL